MVNVFVMKYDLDCRSIASETTNYKGSPTLPKFHEYWSTKAKNMTVHHTLFKRSLWLWYQWKKVAPHGECQLNHQN